MDLQKISNLIKTKRKELGMTQEELANRLFVTEKAISRWETKRGTPDISLLLPLAKELHVDVSELLNGEENHKNDVEKLIEYHEANQNRKYNFSFKLIMLFYACSLFIFLIYLRFEYNPRIELHYFIRLCLLLVASSFIIIGNKIYGNFYVEKQVNEKKMTRLSQWIIFIYYIIFLFNMVLFARYVKIYGFNLIPFHSIHLILNDNSFYAILINIFGNLLIFMPLQYFIIQLFKINKFSLNLGISFLVILSIEILQFIFKVGVFDIDDLFLCTLGSMLFYVIYNKKKDIRK